jgi:hypothetical protein
LKLQRERKGWMRDMCFVRSGGRCCWYQSHPENRKDIIYGGSDEDEERSGNSDVQAEIWKGLRW